MFNYVCEEIIVCDTFVQYVPHKLAVSNVQLSFLIIVNELASNNVVMEDAGSSLPH